MPTSIGFFGDSFCYSHSPNSYLGMIVDRLGLNLVHTGKAGSSIEDAILMQFNKFAKVNKIPDICVFVWTDSHRLYNYKVRNLTLGSLDKNDDPEITQAAKTYYRCLFDDEAHILRHNATVYYFNQVLLNRYPDKKIINLWSFGEVNEAKDTEKETFRIDNVSYPFRFTRGVEIRPALATLSFNESDVPQDMSKDFRPNHLGELKTNIIIANALYDAITEYQDGKLIEIKEQ